MKRRAWLGNRDSVFEIAKSFMKPAVREEMFRKMLIRVREGKATYSSQASAAWCREVAKSVEGFCDAMNSDLWRESLAVADCIRDTGNAKLSALDVDLGGGGHYPLLYFFVRYLRPKVVVETGVAAGFSTAAILTAIKANGVGHLYSSEFVYFRLKNPEKYVGYIVDDELKSNWTLFLEGDRRNIPKILAAVDRVDLLHYDSDKSYSGRRIALKLLTPRLSKGAPVVMDDVQDNLFFRDHVERHDLDASVFEFWGKYLGMYYA
jgi:hypothetical protein